MPVSVTIRHVPEQVRDELAARASREGRSLQEFLVQQLAEIASRPPLDEVIARARDRVHRSGTQLSTQDILGARDEDRR